MGYGYKEDIPQMLIVAQELQKARDYKSSRDIYTKFFNEYPEHYMRFKALFEIADNFYYEKNHEEASYYYEYFIQYCDKQKLITDKEIGWINAYKELAGKRLEYIKTRSVKNYKENSIAWKPKAI